MFKKYISHKELKLIDKNHVSESVNNGKYMFFSQIVSFILITGSTMILARILLPEDFGILAVVVSITSFFSLFKEFGFTMSIIQQEKIRNIEIISLFWINVIIGIVLSLLLILSARFISDFYNDTRLYNIILIMSVTFLISSFSIIPTAILKRMMKFKKIMQIQIISHIIGIVCAISFAMAGFGYWALVINIIAVTLSNAIFTICLLNWFPRINIYFKSITSHIKFGKNIVSFDLINYFSRNLDNLIIGKIYSASILGLYTKAYEIMMLPIKQIRAPLHAVSLPVLSSLKNSNKEFNEYYLNLILLLNIITIPIICFLYLNSSEIIYFMLGENWSYSAEIFSILAFAALIQPVYGTYGLLLISKGLSEKYLKWGIINFIIIITGFFIGSFYDIKTFLIIYVLANYISFIVTTPYVFYNTGISVLKLMKNILIPYVYFLILSIIIKESIVLYEFTKLEIFLYKGLSFLIIYIIFFLLVPEYKRKLFSLKKILKKERKN